jgi:hypothetical protein
MPAGVLASSHDRLESSDRVAKGLDGVQQLRSLPLQKGHKLRTHRDGRLDLVRHAMSDARDHGGGHAGVQEPPDSPDPCDVGVVVLAVPVAPAVRMEEASVLVVAKQPLAHAGELCDSADLHVVDGT